MLRLLEFRMPLGSPAFIMLKFYKFKGVKIKDQFFNRMVFKTPTFKNLFVQPAYHTDAE